VVAVVWLLVTAALFGLAQWLHGGAWPPAGQFARWDGAWYLSVATDGYAAGAIHGQANVAFFPLYPLLVAGVRWLFLVPAWVAGVVVSVASFGAGLVVLYNLARRRYGERTARWATLLAAFNPFALFFGLVYTESLYWLLSVTVFWFIQQRRWWPAAAAAGMVAATRPVGAVLAVMVLAAWSWDRRRAWGQPSQRLKLTATAAGLVILSLSGLLIFAAYLQINNHDALAFAHVQKYWGRTSFADLFPFTQAFVLGVIHRNIDHRILFSDLVWYAATLAGVAGTALLVKQREYLYASYVALGLLVPLSSGSLEGMDRYVMVMFPIYFALANWLHARAMVLRVAAGGLAFALFWLIYLDPRQLFFG
jgi:Gpi18-like mannosyltransferase